MQIRTAILVAGTAVAIVAPTATAGIPWEPTHAATFDSVRFTSPKSTSTAIVPTTENSYGQSKSSSTVNGVKLPKVKSKKTAKAGASHVVTYIVEPMLPASSVAAAPDPNACETSGSDCTDDQLCNIWGMNCDEWAADEAARARAANEQQPSDGQSSSSN